MSDSILSPVPPAIRPITATSFAEDFRLERRLAIIARLEDEIETLGLRHTQRDTADSGVAEVKRLEASYSAAARHALTG